MERLSASLCCCQQLQERDGTRSKEEEMLLCRPAARHRRRGRRKEQAHNRHSTSRQVRNSSLSNNCNNMMRRFVAIQLSAYLLLSIIASQQVAAQSSISASISSKLPDLSATSDEPIVAIIGQDAFISCVAKRLQNYTIIWRFTDDASAPTAAEGSPPPPAGSGEGAAASGKQDMGSMLTAGRERVIADQRFSVIQSHDTWLLKISNVRFSDTGTYICHTNSEPRVRAIRILSVIKPAGPTTRDDQDADGSSGAAIDHFGQIDYNFTECCRAEYVTPRCHRLCNFQQLASRYQSINIVHECFSALPSITRCMVVGRNLTDCCQKRHIPNRCNQMCGHQGDTSAMSVQDQSFCADYSASIMSCVAEGISTLPGQPELVIVEAVSSTTLKVSWQKVAEESELRKIDGWIINLTKLSSFEDTISSSSSSSINNNNIGSKAKEQQHASGQLQAQRVSSSFSGSSSSSSSASTPNSTPLANLTIVDVINNSSLLAMTRLLNASSGTISLKLDKQANEFSIENLKPYTVYQIQMFAYNSLGRSQLTDPIRALTLAPENDQSSELNSASQTDAYVEPNLPDTRKCCIQRGVTLKRCLDTLCDPVEADRATIADLMICAPWSNVTFSCLSSHVNHTDCCKARGVSPFCLSMCSGEVKRVDYRHFRCLTHMSTYTNCILESHNVLPSPPQNFTVGPITHTWAVLNWRAPKRHARSLQGYRILWRRVEPATTSMATGNVSSSSSGPKSAIEGSTAMGLLGDPSPANEEFFYSSAEAATNPYLLDALQPETVYETFVVAVNKFGQSESSVRFVFQTLSDPEKIANSLNSGSSLNGGQEGDIESRLPLHGNSNQALNQQQTYYNESLCCASGGVHRACRQLCDYDIKVSDVSSLVTTCSTQMPVILRCMAGSRNSVPCCRNRGVSEHCLNVCAGLTEHSPLVVATRCAPDFGKIIRCMDEGSKQIPAAPVDLHTVDIKPDRVSIKWAPASEDVLRTDMEYHVRYQQLQTSPAQADGGAQNDPSTLIAVAPLHPLEHNLILSTNKTEATVDKLRANSRYSIYVTAENPYGISLPSLVLVIQTPGEDSDPNRMDEFKRRATFGPPHALEILRSDTESLVLRWLAPLFMKSDEQIKYRVFYKLLPANALQNSTSQLESNQSEANNTNTNNSNTNSSNNQTPQPVQEIASNWTVLETTDTTILLRNLRYSSQYAITVQAFNKQMLGHMSEMLLAPTAKPIPPTLNHPLVINNPIEGGNITLMCVALGQPTPQISMFINGLLVQKRTQPYVIYHLVNLVRGHLTVTCFASNGHGKEYASVQSRTEISVKFGSKATAKAKEVRASLQSTARLSCDITGNPQPTVVWTFKSSTDGEDVNVVLPSERITTLLVSQFDNPFSWSHTLTIRNVSQADIGTYQCRSRNSISESVDTIQLNLLDRPVNSDNSAASSTSSSANQLSNLREVEQTSDLMECCRSQNVSAKCLPVCSVDGLDVEGAFKNVDCQTQLDKLMFCAADGSDHRNCCRSRQVPSSCLRWCSGAKLNIPALCFLSSAMDINQCFLEGRTLLPGPPRNMRVMLASESEHGAADRDASGLYQDDGSAQTTTTTMTTTSGANNMFAIEKLSPTSGNSDTSSSITPTINTGNNNNSSVISSIVMMMGDQQAVGGDSTSTPATDSTAYNDQQQSEPLIIEWDPPSKNPNLVQYYRIFWRPFGSRELSRTVTNLTWIKLNDLNMNKMYEFVVKAANAHGSSVYSDPLTVKPAEILAQSNSISSAGLIWFMPSSSGGSLIGRIMVAICFATVFMFSSLALVMLLERRGYLKRFASSKSNNSRISFANPAYLKDADGNQEGDQVTWDAGHSLDVLATPLPHSQNNEQQQQ